MNFGIDPKLVHLFDDGTDSKDIDETLVINNNGAFRFGEELDDVGFWD